MNTAEMIAKMRQIEDAVPPELNEIVKFAGVYLHEEGLRTNRYCIYDEYEKPGFLKITFNPETGEITAADMNVNFPSRIGFNRSPIELRLLVNHVFQYLPGPEPGTERADQLDASPDLEAENC